MATTSYRIDGMTCDHCVHAVTNALAGVDGVETVDVDLAAGTATVVGSPAPDAVIASVIGDAGYELVTT
jgi:copper chaperone CopZ